MAGTSFSERFCIACKKEGKELKARTFCLECHTLLCESCSKHHQVLGITKDHSLLELVLFGDTSTFHQEPTKSCKPPTNDEKLASDFVEQIVLSDDSSLCSQGATLATEPRSGKDSTTQTFNIDTSNAKEERRMKATKSLTFDVNEPEYENDIYVRAILCISDTVIVADTENEVLKLFKRDGTYLSSEEISDPIWGIAKVSSNRFVTCGKKKKVLLWTLVDKSKASLDVTYRVDHSAQGIHYNGKYYCVIHRKANAIAILDWQGIQIRTITMEEAFGNEFKFGKDILMDSDTNNIYVPCRNEDGVLCLTIEGKALWFSSLSDSPYGIVEIQGILCIADDRCLRLISKNGKYVRKLIRERDLEDEPRYISFGEDGNLYVTFDQESDISVYAITFT
ncbi:hypothetical protein FSP39_005585 [Pinctada imbricata]|uniref:B box-type domain-containing protein n=1 Tax=Pinctada imbricata TaxID=66713 RepID=A0AA88XCR7_PINIB|nr:hypothetical protein FSP39_005585 [Pinctada imbricata]